MELIIEVESEEKMSDLEVLMDKYILGLKPMYPRVYSYKVNDQRTEMIVNFDSTDGIKMVKIFKGLGHEVSM
jgi:hypothetical protein